MYLIIQFWLNEKFIKVIFLILNRFIRSFSVRDKDKTTNWFIMSKLTTTVSIDPLGPVTEVFSTHFDHDQFVEVDYPYCFIMFRPTTVKPI